jgi:hypothetical protein
MEFTNEDVRVLFYILIGVCLLSAIFYPIVRFHDKRRKIYKTKNGKQSVYAGSRRHIITSKVTTNGFISSYRVWEKDHIYSIITNTGLADTRLSDGKGGEIKIPMKDWESFVMFLAESCAIADNAGQGKAGDIEITMSITKK